MWMIHHCQNSSQESMNNMEDLDKIHLKVIRKNLKFFV